MEVNITQPLGFSQLGSRTNNEDTLFPDPQTTNPLQKWFMVCDGVGGAERGEVASQLAASEFDRYFRNNPVSVVTDDYIQQALDYVQDRFDEYVQANPQAESMGTTLTLVYRHEAGITVAHVGDSRVYLVREGSIEWRTDDHSYVNELVKAGALKPEEARRHPQRNVITRAIQSGQKRARADVQLLNDLKTGDYLFMCTDGILERVSDELLEKTLGSAEPNDEKLRTLLACCYGHTRDNFTAYLLQVDYVTGSVASSARVKPPSYTRPEGDDNDDAVTLIGVPRPEALPSYANLADRNDVPVRRQPVQAAREVPPDQHRPMTTPQAVSQQEKVSGRWRPWLLVAVFLGVGIYFLWDRYGGLLTRQTVSSEPPKAVTSSPINDPAVAVANVSNQLKQSRQTTDSAGRAQQAAVAESVTTSTEGETLTDLSIPATDEKRLTVVDFRKSLNLEVTKDKSGKFGLRQMVGGKEIFEPKFQKINLQSYKFGLMAARLNGEKKIISKKGAVYDERGEFSAECGLVPVKKDGAWAYLNINGEVEIKSGPYIKAGPFDDKTCTAEVTDQNRKTYRIDKTGKQQSPAPVGN